MPGTGPNPGPGVGPGGTGHDATKFYGWLRTRLTGKDSRTRYQEVAVTPEMYPLQLAFTWQGSAMWDPRSIGVVNTGVTANSPSQVCEQVKHWFQETHPHQGGPALLLFVCYDPSAAFVEEIKKGPVYAGNVCVDLSAYDLPRNHHWSTSTTNCVADVFDS